MKIKWKVRDSPITGIGSKWIITQNVEIKGDIVTWTKDAFDPFKDLGYDFQCENGNWWIIDKEVRLATKEEINSHQNK